MVNESWDSTVGIEPDVLGVLDIVEREKAWFVGQSQDIQRKDDLPTCIPLALVDVMIPNRLPGVGSHVMHVDRELLAVRHS